MGPEQVIGGRYRLLDPLGEGGMSVVWRARDEVLGRMVAVKVLGSELVADPAARAIVLAEAQSIARVSHPNVAGVYDYGEWISPHGQAVPYVVMELLSGPSLAQRLADGPLDPRRTLLVAAEVAAGLAAAHGAGVVHRDVKPGNIILSPAGAKVVDFGIAALEGEPDGIEADGRILGTPSYLPPERIRRGVAVPASDMYAWGVLLHCMLTGQLPWPPDAMLLDRVDHVQRADPLPGVSADIDALFHRCLASDPTERPSAREAALIAGAAAGLRPALGIVAAIGSGTPADDPTAHLSPRPAVPYATHVPLLEAAFGGAADALPHPARRPARRLGARVAMVAAVPATVTAVVLVLAYGLDGSTGLDDDPAGQPPLPTVAASVPPGPGGELNPSAPSSAVVPGSTVVPGTTAQPGGPVVMPPPGGGGPVPLLTRPPVPPTTITTSPPSTSTSAPPPPATPRPSPTPTPTHPSGPVTLWSPGGTVLATCQLDLVHVVSASPAPGYILYGGLPGPGTLVEVRFRPTDGLRLDDDDVRMRIWCVNGLPESEFD